MKLNGRFYIEDEKDSSGYWNLVDTIDGTLIGFKKKSDAKESLTFARQYVKRHGDIDFLSFPYSIDTPLHYESYNGRERIQIEDKIKS